MKFDFETQDFVNTLQEMLQDYGRMALTDGKKCYSLWLDYAPQLPEEGELLKVFLELDLGKQVVELKTCSAEQRVKWKKQAIENMVHAGETQKDAANLVDAVLEALGWSAKQETISQVRTESTVIKPEKLVEPAPTPIKITEKPEKQKDVTKPVVNNTRIDKKTDSLKKYARFGPEEKIAYLNKHLPKIIGYKIAVIPNNVTNWESLSKYMNEFSREFQAICPKVTELGINSSDIILGMISEGGILKHVTEALVFTDECIYLVGSNSSWKIKYKDIERIDLQNNAIFLYKRTGGRESISLFRVEYNAREVYVMLKALVEGEKWRTEVIHPNSQEIESPAKVESNPYYVKPQGLQPGNCLLCRTSSQVRWDNFVKECMYISQARKLLVCGKNKNGSMLYVEIGPECRGWIFANSVKRC